MNIITLFLIFYIYLSEEGALPQLFHRIVIIIKNYEDVLIIT